MKAGRTREGTAVLFLLLITLIGITLVSACTAKENGGADDLVDWPPLESLGDYPRPDRVRQEMALLTGAWDFAFDPWDVGLSQQWHLAPDFPETIIVPFCVESEASGVADTSPLGVFWYSRSFSCDTAGAGQVLLHFGAVDYHAMVWLNGVFLGEHFGGYTPFSFEVGDLIASENTIVVRVEDRLSLVRPRGKQSVFGQPFEVFYETVSGIWQPVWLEDTGPTYIDRFRAREDLETGDVAIRVHLAGASGTAEVRAVAISPDGDEVTARATVEKTESVQVVDLILAFDSLVPWSPEDPNLYSLRLVVGTDGGRDVVDSYFGARSIEIDGDDIHLNGESLYQKLTLNQGYYAGGHYTPVDPLFYRRDIELVKEYGFNGLRMHEKIESPQLLFWADYLGALVWEELPTAWWFGERQNENLEREWREAVLRDINHPSIITWLPFNESWGLGLFGVGNFVVSPRVIAFMKHMVAVTRELDPRRPVIDNSGWDHTEATDVVDIHHYLPTLERAAELYEELEDLYGYRWSLRRLLEPGINNNIFAPGESYRGQPILVSEYGGFGWYAWEEPGDVVEAYRQATVLIQAQPHIDGYCYTQFNDTYQEENGLVDMERNYILPAEAIKAINDLIP